MKKLFYMGMGALLCLSWALCTGCDKDKEKAPEIVMVYVAGGTFSMGATEEQGEEARDNEKPIHEVTLDGFYIGKYEVTQAQWKAVMGTTVEQQRDKVNQEWGLDGVGDNYPMYYVNWEEAQAFCSKMSEMTGKTYRLPTESEWEYAARGGQQADGMKYAGSNIIDDVAWYSDNSGNEMHPVGMKQANALGLCDMSGNVWEWCSDWDGAYGSAPVVNPQGASSGSYRIYRGGGWSNNAKNCRVSIRGSRTPDFRHNNLGFRVVCEQ